MPLRWTFKWKDFLSRGPSLDHHGATPTVAWVMSLSVRLGSTIGLTTLVSYISVGEWRFEERGHGDVHDALNPKLDKSMIKLENERW